ncbi:NUDIX domain-containing protein [Methylocella sp. CPCC 101449]|uniref:NUDIX hydrolase n=1 Tax=Methylocella sp. CPCC 101449 TaxID=2987531 RepID=UPI0028915B31|nr:NUDIX domain-containing protein [Methylocella sp. CPCC 101449]MDT2022109.1 NUDIX domain-containing protein [Methylocella sp. CPCC 101449]
MSSDSAPLIVRIAAAVIRDGQGRFLLVRKRGTTAFMQAGGKIESGETSLTALQRELLEELGLAVEAGEAKFLGCFEADAANEPGHKVRADLFELFLDDQVAPAAEIEELIWLSPSAPEIPILAPLTRDHVLRLPRQTNEH